MFGPSRGELIFRLLFSLVGLGLVGVVLAVRGRPSGPAFIEIFVIAGGFFGGTTIWTLVQLRKHGRRPSGDD